MARRSGAAVARRDAVGGSRRVARQAVDGAPGDGPLGSNKKADGEPNVFGFDGMALDGAYALKVIDETHASWRALASGAVAAGELELK